ncbi:MAG: cytochrome c oxidase subunit II [Gemmatimonadetes bacterium]|nr:cytochrome c oxidase subunit II [Gemmatimonadota bacterium]
MSWILPPSASTFAGDIDFLYYVILVITGIAFVVVEGGLIWFMIKYRTRPGRKAEYTQGSTKAEIIWTAVPAVTVVIIGLMSGGVWNDIKGRNSVPPDAIPYGIHAQQFEWNFTYRGPDGQLGTGDDFSLRNQLHIPVNRPVVMRMTAEDVIHSFFIPAFRVKQDAVPGMLINVWFEATEEGEYEIACAELCGLGHYRMRARVIVHSADDYQRWLADQAAAADDQ